MRLPKTSGNPSDILSSMPAETWDALMDKRPAVIALLQQVQEGMPIYLLIPVAVVIAMAIMKVDTIICLATGIISAAAFGTMAGTIVLAAA